MAQDKLLRLTGMFPGKTKAGAAMFSGTLRAKDIAALEKLLAHRAERDIVVFAFKADPGEKHAFTLHIAYSRDQGRRIMDDSPKRPEADDSFGF